jgi:hypothetical protein
MPKFKVLSERNLFLAETEAPEYVSSGIKFAKNSPIQALCFDCKEKIRINPWLTLSISMMAGKIAANN